MNFKSDYEKLKYKCNKLETDYKIKTKEINKLKRVINNLNYNIDILENKINIINVKNQQLSLLVDEYIKEMRSLRDGKTKNNK